MKKNKLKGVVTNGKLTNPQLILNKVKINSGQITKSDIEWFDIETIDEDNTVKRYLFPNTNLVNIINHTTIKNIEPKTINVGRKKYLIKTLDKDFWYDVIVDLYINKLINEDELNLNFIHVYGSGIWLTNGHVVGYSGINGYQFINPLTCTKDYGYRPYLEFLNE